MANVPVDSLTTGGVLWFVDLTIPDQYYALPVITCVTIWAILEVSARLNSCVIILYGLYLIFVFSLV